MILSARILLRFLLNKTTAIQLPPPKQSLHPQAMPVYGLEIIGLVQRLSERERGRERWSCLNGLEPINT